MTDTFLGVRALTCRSIRGWPRCPYAVSSTSQTIPFCAVDPISFDEWPPSGACASLCVTLCKQTKHCGELAMKTNCVSRYGY